MRLQATPESSPVNPLNPKKLLLSKWTAVNPTRKEKHFLVTNVIEPDPPEFRIEWVEIQAVYSRRTTRIHWRELQDDAAWLLGWL
jgi:tryptophan-rich hypothetical protein